MRVLLVGLGRWGEKHLRVLTELGVSAGVNHAYRQDYQDESQIYYRTE